LEWGQVPSCLEVLTSETIDTRQTITIYPATGCAVDNMETRKTVQLLNNATVKSLRDIRVLHFIVDQVNHQIEASFAFPDNHRARMMIPLVVQSYNNVAALSIGKPITIVLDRLVIPHSILETVANNGGLDGQSVSRMLGEFLKTQRTFAEDKVNRSLTEIVCFPGNFTLASNNCDGLFLEIGHVAEGMHRIASIRVGRSPDKSVIDTRIQPI
jgi:hypothetical protein